MRPENFIYFLTVCGFFVGVLFAMFAPVEPAMVIWVALGVTAVFYMIGLASASYFIHYTEIKTGYHLDSTGYDENLDKFREILERRERFISDSTDFIRNLETEIREQKAEEESLFESFEKQAG